MRLADFPYLPKDFIETEQGLLFAVVCYQPQQGQVGCFLRYLRSGDQWQKIDTEQANKLLTEKYPQYYYRSAQFDADFHAVRLADIRYHHCPEQRLQHLLANKPIDDISAKLVKLIAILADFGADTTQFGITGSLLINQQRPNSDIDLVIYGRKAFYAARQAVQQAVDAGELTLLSPALMMDNYQRRAPELDLATFSWHEQRKFNKAVIDGSKFDIGMVCTDAQVPSEDQQYQKIAKKTLTTTVIDDRGAFDFPAYYRVDNQLINEIIVYTHSYVGQAKMGETITVSGMVERNVTTGKCRLIVGSSREAKGEYIKVCN